MQQEKLIRSSALDAGKLDRAQELLAQADKLDRALDLLSLAYREMRSPYKSGPAWAQYRAQSARIASDALWEAHQLLAGRPPTIIDS
jgi:hypothetical protein